jgi:hypothetical protein
VWKVCKTFGEFCRDESTEIANKIEIYCNYEMETELHSFLCCWRVHVGLTAVFPTRALMQRTVGDNHFRGSSTTELRVKDAAAPVKPLLTNEVS